MSQENQFSCNFCNKKFPTSQALGGHQNAHKKERKLLNMELHQKMNPFGFRPNNVPLYPNSISSLSNHPLQSAPFYQGAHTPNTLALAPPGFSINQGMTSSWPGGAATTTSPRNLNPKPFGLWQQQTPSLAETESESLVGSSSYRVVVANGTLTLQRSPTVSTEDSPSEDLDLTLKL